MKPRGGLFPKTLGKSIEALIKPVLKQHGLTEARIVTDWPIIAGADIAKRCTPVKITFPKGKQDNGTLHVQAQHGFAVELPYHEGLILEKMAMYFGHRAVARIKIEQVYPTPTPPQIKPDKEMGDALAQLAESLKP